MVRVPPAKYYKLRWNGGRLIAVSPRNTSITCPRCRHIGKENRLSQAQFECVACELQENADLVGALNVLRTGHARHLVPKLRPLIESDSVFLTARSAAKLAGFVREPREELGEAHG
jgi:transposase